MKQGILGLFFVLSAATAWSQNEFRKVTLKLSHFPVSLFTRSYDAMTDKTTENLLDETIDVRELSYPFYTSSPGDMISHTLTNGPRTMTVQWDSATNFIKHLTYKYYLKQGPTLTDESVTIDNLDLEPGGGIKYIQTFDHTKINGTNFTWKKITSGPAAYPGSTYYNEYTAESSYFTNTEIQVIVEIMKPPLAVGDEEHVAFSVYPNPATTAFTIRGLGNENVFITDVFGTSMRMEPTYSTDTESVFDIRSLRNGVYTLRCGSKTKQLIVVK